jgi:hypothetical protein
MGQSDTRIGTSFSHCPGTSPAGSTIIRRRLPVGWFAPLLVMTLLRSGLAQMNGPFKPLDDKLRTAEFLREPERASVQESIQKQAEALLDETTSLEAKRKIREEFRQILARDPAPSAQFRDRFVMATVQTFMEYFQAKAGTTAPHTGAGGAQTSEGDPAGLMVMAMILYDMREWLPLQSLRQGALPDVLANPYPAVRFWIAKTIKAKQRIIADLPAVRAVVLGALRLAGMRESDDPALREMYLALDFTQTLEKVPFADEVAEVYVDILEARGKMYVARKVTASDADPVALTAMEHLAVPLKDGERTRYLTALARFLCGASEGYISQLEISDLARRDPALIRRQLLLVRDTEKQLRHVLREAGVRQEVIPNLFQKMEGGSVDEIRSARTAWCGWPPNDQGILNSSAFAVPLGAGFAEAVTQPATGVATRSASSKP